MTPEAQIRFPAAEVALRNGEQVTVRPLLKDDTDRLASFYAAVPGRDIRFYYPHPLDREHAVANARKADNPYEVVLVLETADDSIAGYAWYRWREADAEKTHFGICVRPDYQGVGAGATLMTRLMEVAEEEGPPVMCLTVQLANERAVVLYRKMGFNVVREGIRKPFLDFTPEPQYWMERSRR